MTDKMRDDFEAWALTHFINSETMNPLERDDGDQGEYRFSRVNMAWIAWQASRESLVIELPQIVGYEAGFDSIRDNEFAGQSSVFFDADEVFELSRRIEVIEAIEAAGLKVKP